MPSEVKAQDTTSLASIKTVNEAATQSRALLAEMEQAAEDAGTTLQGIYQDAADAQTAADSAKQSADTAYTNLSQIQSVLEVAQWIATHGTYVKATLFNPNATYYTITAMQVTEPSDDDKDSQGVLIYYELNNSVYVRTTDTNVQTGKTYYRVTGTPVAQPSAEHIADYYTLAVSEAMADYVQSHLALTDEGLWIIKDGSGYKLKLTDYGSYIVAPDGTTVVNQNTADGNIIRALDGTVIAHLGYGEGQSQSGTARTPYYTFGTRKTTDTPYDSTATYSVGDLCVYNDKLYVCSVEITTPEQWNSSHWKLAIGNWSVTEGIGLVASELATHAEGRNNSATGIYSHAEGNGTTASGRATHAEGSSTTASGSSSHAEGSSTTASGTCSHAEGVETTASGRYSHAQNYGTIAEYEYQTAIGRYNSNESDSLFEIGNGDLTQRSNAFTVDWNGIVSARDKANRFSDIFDLLRPVGSAYPTTDPNFDPNVSWGGTWKLMPEGYILLSGSERGSYQVGKDQSKASGYKEYGRNAQTLTVGQLPKIEGTFDVRKYQNNSGTIGTQISGSTGVFTRGDGSATTQGLKSGTSQNGETTVKMSFGNNEAHNNMQLSIAVYWWIRVE